MMLTALPESRKARSSCEPTRMGRRGAPHGEVSSGCRGDVTYTPVLAGLTSGLGECLKNGVMWTRVLILVPSWLGARGRETSGSLPSYAPEIGGMGSTSRNGSPWSCGPLEGNESTRSWMVSMSLVGHASRSAGEGGGGRESVRGSVWGGHKGAVKWTGWGSVKVACAPACCHACQGNGTPGVSDGVQATGHAVGWV